MTATASTSSGASRWQVAVYLGAIAAGAGVGSVKPGLGEPLAVALWPLLALLLFATFLQFPLSPVGILRSRRRFLVALLAGNFVAVPALVWALAWLLPDQPSIRLAFFAVLLAPCTDWFNTFAHLGKGDGRLSLAATPLLLLAQLLALPLLLALVLGPEVAAGMRAEPFLRAFFGVVLAPLALALAVKALARRSPAATRALSAGWVPVPILACVLLVVAATSIEAVVASATALFSVAALFGAYLLVAPFLAVGASRLARLGPAEARTVTFSLGTRNSFVILPLVLAWPGAGEVAVAVVVLQSLVELVGMTAYVALVPRWVGR